MLALDEFFHMMIDALLEGVEDKYGEGVVSKPVATPIQGEVRVCVQDAAGMTLEIDCQLRVEAEDASQVPEGFPGH